MNIFFEDIKNWFKILFWNINNNSFFDNIKQKIEEELKKEEYIDILTKKRNNEFEVIITSLLKDFSIIDKDYKLINKIYNLQVKKMIELYLLYGVDFIKWNDWNNFKENNRKRILNKNWKYWNELYLLFFDLYIEYILLKNEYVYWKISLYKKLQLFFYIKVKQKEIYNFLINTIINDSNIENKRIFWENLKNILYITLLYIDITKWNKEFYENTDILKRYKYTPLFYILNDYYWKITLIYLQVFAIKLHHYFYHNIINEVSLKYINNQK